MVGQAALNAVASLPEAREAAAETLFTFLTVSEPVVDLLPEYFLLDRARASVDQGTLQQLALAGKLLYAHIRWLDDLADQRGSSDHSLDAHPLSDALSRLIQQVFANALNEVVAPLFFSTLAHLYSRYSMSLAVDQGFCELLASPPPFEHYLLHAKARAAPVRAPVDAILLLTNATRQEAREAQFSFECYAAALQLFDDALDLEEDYEDRRLSWLVQRVVARLRDSHSAQLPDADLFYRTALLEGFLVDNLSRAEDLFVQSATSSRATFPRWAVLADHMVETTNRLKKEYQDLVDGAT